ncbi:MAG: hypothetical protein JWP01_2983 [Myxococcales bacterium]|nr:hypothetical protein [Myxococcales bacterium]
MSRLAPALAAIAILASACKDKGKDTRDTPTGSAASSTQAADAGVAPLDWTACKTALEAAPKLPATRRAQALIDGCQPCGDWTPILAWNKLPADGGPTRAAIEAAMLACKAYCEPNAKQRFLGTLDDARMKDTRTPWRELGTTCKDKVSAVPDARYMSATYFALDRIARDVATRPGGPELLGPIEIPMPPVSVSGVGVKLPEAPTSKPELMQSALTVTLTELSLGALPIARLGAGGVTIGGDPFPGASLSAKELPSAIAQRTGRVALFAPAGMPASRITEVVQIAGGKAELVLAVTAQPGPGGWAMYGIVPIALRPAVAHQVRGVTLALSASADEAIKAAKAAGPDTLRAAPIVIRIDRTATVGSLAALIGALAFFGVDTVALVP